MKAANAGGNDFKISLREFGDPPLLNGQEQGKVPEADEIASAAGPGKYNIIQQTKGDTNSYSYNIHPYYKIIELIIKFRMVLIETWGKVFY